MRLFLVIVVVASFSAIACAQVDWQRNPTSPILQVGLPGSFDELHVVDGKIIKIDGTYLLYYKGENNSNRAKIGYAISTDLVHWTKQGIAIDWGSQGAWDNQTVFDPHVVQVGNSWRMYYTGGNESELRIGIAESNDGLLWTKYSGNPVLSGPQGGSNEIHVLNSEVRICNSFMMWYAGYRSSSLYSIGLATSPDGFAWTKYASNPVLQRGSVGQWDARYVWSPCVMVAPDGYRLWYDGADASDVRRIGYAASLDGVHWTKYAGNPVLNLGSAETWDRAGLSNPFILEVDSMYYMFYTGNDGQHWRIGLATARADRPVATNILIQQRQAPSELVDVTYDLFTVTNGPATVTMTASIDGGMTFPYPINTISGDWGTGVLSGRSKYAVWNAGADLPNITSGQTKIKIIVNEGTSSIGGFTYLGQFQNHQYYLSQSSLDWPQAQQACLAAGGHLVCIGSQVENDFVLNTVPSSLYYVWIGFNDMDVEGAWRWVNGESLIYTNWGAGEPNNLTPGEDYGQLRGDPLSPLQGTWNDWSSGHPSQFVMEIP